MSWFAKRLLAELEGAAEDEHGARRVMIGGVVLGGPAPVTQIALSISSWVTIEVQRAPPESHMAGRFFYAIDTPAGSGAGAPLPTLDAVAESIARTLDEWSLRG